MIPKRKKQIDYLVWDVETISQPEEILLANAPEFRPDSRLKDPEKIAASIAEKKQDYLDKAALHWATAQVACVGIGDEQYIDCIAESTEQETIQKFLNIASRQLELNQRLVGHNILGFDLPMIINRARALKIKVPSIIGGMKYGRWSWNENIIDTLTLFSFGDKQKIEGNSVQSIARACELPSKLGDGADFGKLWKENRPAAISYCKRDVEIEIGIYKLCAE